MSHFAVTVAIAANNFVGVDSDFDNGIFLAKVKCHLNDKLQPFHEYECTGIEDEFVVWVDCHDEALDDYERYCDDKENLSFEQYTDGDGYTKNGGRYGRVTNPNAQWDWWVEGGRWRGFWNPKASAAKGSYRASDQSRLSTDEQVNGRDTSRDGRSDAILKSAIDFQSDREIAFKKAHDAFDEYEQAVNGVPNNYTWEQSLELAKSRGGEKNFGDVAREIYHEQPWYIQLEEWRKDKGPFASADDFIVGRDAYVADRVDSTNTSFAFIDLEGKWNERGSMGWWGCVSDETDGDKWNKIYQRWMDSLPEDTVLINVDCHI